MAEKAPCRWATETWDCSHPLARHLVGSSGCWMKSLPWISPATCEGCPCHEPVNLPEIPDSSTAPPDTQRTDPQDEYMAPLRMQFSLTSSDAKCVLIGPNGERREFPADTPYEVINAAAQAMNRTDPPNCDWHRDEFGNWFSGCSETMPDFTPWKGTDPKGSFCPKCGKNITVRVHDKP